MTQPAAATGVRGLGGALLRVVRLVENRRVVVPPSSAAAAFFIAIECSVLPVSERILGGCAFHKRLYLRYDNAAQWPTTMSGVMESRGALLRECERRRFLQNAAALDQEVGTEYGRVDEWTSGGLRLETDKPTSARQQEVMLDFYMGR